jgi:hypothetical protein
MKLVPLDRVVFRDADGVPISGGQLFVAQANTNNLVSVFLDAEGKASTKAYPILLTTEGKASVWLPADRAYHVTVKNQWGSLVLFEDLAFNPAGTAGGSGGPASTDELPEGAANAYFTPQRALDAVAEALATKAPATHAHPFYTTFGLDILAVLTGSSRWYPTRAAIITKIEAWLGVAPTGSAVTVNLKKNGAVAASLTLPVGQNTMEPLTVDIAMTTADYLTADVTAVDSGATGKNLSIRMTLQ